MSSRLGEAENHITRLGNVVAQLDDHRDRGIKTAEQQLKVHHRRMRTGCGTGYYELVTTRDSRGNVSLRYAIARPITRRQAYLFGV